ncbi:MAG: septation protein SepH, partial [Acidimicrobiia bacterium]
MQKLHPIGFTTDLDGLIFSARRGTRSGGFTVEIDDDLIRTIEEVMRLRANGEDEEVEEGQEEHPTGAWRVTVPQPESVLTPREIQARLRTGATLAEVAEEAGVDEEWVARFAPPVWAEQSRIIATAQRLVLEKPRVGVSAEPLGDSVRTNLAERGTIVDDESFDSAWGAYHVTASTWVVTFDPPGKGRRQVAMWQLDTAAETLTSANRAASDLGYATAKGRRRNRAQEGANEEALARVARTATKKSEAVRQQAAKKTAKKTAKKPAGRAGTVRKAPTKVAPRKATPRKVAAKKAAVKKSSAKKTATAKKTKAPPTPRVTVAAVPPPAPPTAPAPRPAPV